jgi:hypothetical protein
MFWVPMAVMAAAGAAKHYLSDKPIADQQKRIEAIKARYSPWTGIKPQTVATPNAAGNIIQFGATGLNMGYNMEAQEQSNKLNDAMTSYYKGGGAMGRANLNSYASGVPAGGRATYGQNPWSLYDKAPAWQQQQSNPFGVGQTKPSDVGL